MTEVHFSWNLVADLRQMWSLPFMVNAFRAGTLVAVLAGVVGWFMVLRRQTFAGHTLAVVGFPGAAGSVLAGLGAATGYYAGCVTAAVTIAALPGRGSRGRLGESALVGTVQAVALATGTLFVAMYHGFLGGTSALLFGSFLGITRRDVLVLAAVAAGLLALVAAVGRPLLFASVDPDVARVAGVPVRWLDAGFLVLLGVAAAGVSQITGSLLVFALLVLPAATAQRLAVRPGPSLALSVLLALVTVWLALFVGYYSPYPIGFWLTSIAFGMYLPALAVRR